MKAKEFIPASKPRNFVAKNQKTAGAGAHKDKRKAEKQGNVKHKRDLMPMETALRDKEDLQAKRKTLQDLSMNKDVDQKAVQQRKLDLEKEAKKQGMAEGWKDEADDFSEWTDYVKERLTKASPEQRLGLAKKLSQVEVKSFGSSLSGGFDRNTGKAKTGELTDTVRSALRYFNSEQDSIRRQRDQDGAPGNFSMPFGSVDIPGMENATPEELAVMKKAVMMGPEVAGAAAKLYKKNGTITSQDLKDIESGFEKASGIEFGKPMYSSPEAKAGRERAMAGEGVTEGAEDLTPNWAKYVLDQLYNSNGAVTMTDLFDEGIPGLRDMFMATAEELGLDPDEDFMDVESEVLEKLEELIGGQDVEEGTPGNNFRVGQRVIYKNSQGQEFPSIVTAVDFDEDAVKIKSANNKPFPNSGGDIEIVVDPGWRFLTPEPRVDPNSIIAVSPTMRKTTERVRDPEDWDEGNTEPGNNFAVYINGKKWKVLPGPTGAYADSPEEKRELQRLKGMAQRKTQETGKKWEVYVTGEPATK